MNNHCTTTSDPLAELDLSPLDEEFASVPLREPGFKSIPDGKYEVRVEKVKLTRTKTSARPMLTWTLRLLSSDFRGRCLWRRQVIQSGESLRWIKTDLHLCGLDLERLSDLPEGLHRLVGVRLVVTKRTRTGRTNVYFNRALQS